MGLRGIGVPGMTDPRHDRWDPPTRLFQAHPMARSGIRELGAERPWAERPSLRRRLRVALERARRAA